MKKIKVNEPAESASFHSDDAATEAARKPKLGEKVGKAIITEIREKHLPVGTLIGTEAELIERYGVSRATLLEAIRQIERQGVVEMRRGGRGGLIVSRPASRSVARVLSNYLEFSDISLSEQLDCARFMDAIAARKAAQNATEEEALELRELAALAEAADNYLDMSRLGLNITGAIANASGNPAVALFERTLLHLRADFFRGERSRNRPIDATMVKFSAELTELVETIVAGDQYNAEELAKAHRDALRSRLMKRFEKLKTSASPLVTAAMQRRDAKGREKRAEVLAFEIRDELIEKGWPVGKKLGEEANLLSKFGVSKWVFRQAIRMLEPHGIIKVRRGNGGGLFIDRPDPAYTIGIATSYLESERLSPQEALNLWASLLVEAASLSGKIAQQSENAQQDANHFEVLPAADGALASRFYDAVFELCGNRVLSLFGRVLFKYWSAELDTDPHVPGEECQKILQPILAGDHAMARRRMRAYIRSYNPL